MSEQKHFSLEDIDWIDTQLEYLSCDDPEDIEVYIFEMLVEDEQGREGNIEVSTVKLAGQAHQVIQQQQARIEELEKALRLVFHECTHHRPSVETQRQIKEITAEALNNSAPAPDVRSQIEKDGLPTFYISTEGAVCTHRMSDTDTPVWCRNGEDGVKAMRAITEGDGWTSIDERLPEQSGPYWTFCGNEEPSVIQQRVLMYDSKYKQFNDCSATHWRKLPAKPAAGGAE